MKRIKCRRLRLERHALTRDADDSQGHDGMGRAASTLHHAPSPRVANQNEGTTPFVLAAPVARAGAHDGQ
jgi:hypothetical protein